MPRIDLWGTPSLKVVTEGYGPFKTTLCFLASSVSIIKLNKSPVIQFINESIVPNFIKCFLYIKENTSDFISNIKGFTDFMSDGKELICTISTWFKTRLVKRK